MDTIEIDLTETDRLVFEIENTLKFNLIGSQIFIVERKVDYIDSTS